MCILENWNAWNIDLFIQHRIRISNYKKSLFIWWLWWWSKHRLYSLYMTNKYFLSDKNNKNETKPERWTLNRPQKPESDPLEHRRHVRKIFMWGVFLSNKTATTTTNINETGKEWKSHTALCAPCALCIPCVDSLWNDQFEFSTNIEFQHCFVPLDVLFSCFRFFSFEIQLNVCRCAFWTFLLK